MSVECLHVGRPRVGLLGNPSDLYRGRVIGFTFEDFGACVRLTEADRSHVVGPGGDVVTLGSPAGLEPESVGGGAALMVAALAELHAHAPDRIDWQARPLRLEATSDIPQQVGLSGSSAIVVACLRVLAEFFGVTLTNFECSELALRAETIRLGQVAGPQDRVLQSYTGAWYMDFSEPRRDDRYQPLGLGQLPPLLVAYDPQPGQDSGRVHSEVHARWAAGDAEVRAGVARFSELAAQGLDDLRGGDMDSFCDRVDANLKARCALWQVASADLERAAVARAAGAAAKLCGSGGALVVVPRPGVSMVDVRTALEQTGWSVLAPTLSSAGRAEA